MTSRWPRRGLLLAGAAIVVLLAAAVIDYALTSAALPDYGPGGDDPSLPNHLDPVGLERTSLAHDYGIRAWLYMLGGVGVVAALTIAALRAAPTGRRRELFTDLGITGVVCGVVTILVASDEPDLISNSNNGAVVWVPTLALLSAAATGGLIFRARGLRGRSPGDGETSAAPRTRPRGFSSIPPVSWAGVVLTALTLVLVLAAGSGRECGVPAPEWSDNAIWASLITGIAAFLFGAMALFSRRWVAALVSIPGPLLALFAMAAAACLS